MAIRLEVARDSEAVAAAAAGEFLRLAAEAIRGGGEFRAALAGGETPRATYRRIASAWRDLPGGPLAWDRVHLFWGDERMVAADDSRSNYGMAREALISRVPIPAANVHPIPDDAADPGRAASRYEQTLRTAFGIETGRSAPRFDLVFLGMGADGHTASLFPGDPVLEERSRWVAATRHPASGEPRVTLTLPVLNRAAALVVLVSGSAKATALEQVVRDADDTKPMAPGDGAAAGRFPISRLHPVDGTLLYLADRQAAAWMGRDTPDSLG